jgi:hypothetical protein
MFVNMNTVFAPYQNTTDHTIRFAWVVFLLLFAQSIQIIVANQAKTGIIRL